MTERSRRFAPDLVPGTVRAQRLRLVWFGLWVLLTGALLIHHEPWRDEADAWLMARDATVGEVLRIAGHSGTPGLWYFLQMPFAKAGAGYATQGLLNLALMAGAALLFLTRAPVPLVAKVLVLFGFHLSFEYPVVARNYSLGIALAFGLAALDARRNASSLLYGALLGALANVSAHFLVLAAAFGLAWAWEFRPGRGRLANAPWMGLVVAFAGCLASALQLRPRPDGQFSPDLIVLFEPQRVLAAARGLVPQVLPTWLLPLGVLGFGLAVLHLAASVRALWFLLLSTAGLTYIFVFKYSGGDRHYGLLLIVLLVALWVAEGEEQAGVAHPVFAAASRLRERSRTATYGVLSLCFGITVLHSALVLWPAEIRQSYSGASDMGNFLRREKLDERPIAAHHAHLGEAVLPYLRTRAFYYPALESFGSHMLWDRRYMEGTFVTQVEALARIERRFPDWQGGRLLFLASEEVPNAAARGFRLLHRTAERPFRIPEESYFLYERKR